MPCSRLERSLLLAARGPLLTPPDGEGGGAAGEGDPKAGDGEKKDDNADLEKIEGLGDKGKEAIKAERAAAKAAAEEARKAKEERDALLKEKTDREAAE